MKLSVVILNYNVRYFLHLCLCSVQKALEGIDSEIIVVDNNSPDDSCAMVEAFFPDVILIRNKENLGFSKGNNIGVREAKGEYVCILNPDTVVGENTFKIVLAEADQKKDLGAMGCKLIDGTGKFLPESKRNIPYPTVALLKLLGNSKRYYVSGLDEDQNGISDILVGAFMLLKREVYLDIGGFDEDYFMYGEDVDLSYKLLKKGYKNYYCGKATAIHYKGESTLKDAVYARRFYGAMQLFYKKHLRKNLLFDFAVWAGLKVALMLRKPPPKRKNQVERYMILGKRPLADLESKLNRPVIYTEHLDEIPEYGTELIFDNESIPFEEMFSIMIKLRYRDRLSFKILPKNLNFILGSDDSINKGEVIIF